MSRTGPKDHRIDGNQREIVDTLRAENLSVLVISSGDGVDIVVGGGNRNLLVEIKEPGKSLNAKQREFHRNWAGAIMTAENASQILRKLGRR